MQHTKSNNTTKNILDLCIDFKIKRIFYSSSSEVYGEPVETPQKESSPINASLPYAAVKYMSELYCKSYFDKFGLVASSPELLVQLRNGKITIRPIAGTRKRGKNAKKKTNN